MKLNPNNLTVDQFMHRKPLNRRANEFVTTGRAYDEDAAKALSPVILIISNGSRWAGEEPADFEELLQVLRCEPLRPEDDDCFTDPSPISCTSGKPLLPSGWLWTTGNFHRLSHVFHVVTNCPVAMAELTEALANNVASEEYQQAKREVKAHAERLAKIPKFKHTRF